MPGVAVDYLKANHAREPSSLGSALYDGDGLGTHCVGEGLTDPSKSADHDPAAAHVVTP